MNNQEIMHFVKKCIAEGKVTPSARAAAVAEKAVAIGSDPTIGQMNELVEASLLAALNDVAEAIVPLLAPTIVQAICNNSLPSVGEQLKGYKGEALQALLNTMASFFVAVNETPGAKEMCGGADVVDVVLAQLISDVGMRP